LLFAAVNEGVVTAPRGWTGRNRVPGRGCTPSCQVVSVWGYLPVAVVCGAVAMMFLWCPFGPCCSPGNSTIWGSVRTLAQLRSSKERGSLAPTQSPPPPPPSQEFDKTRTPTPLCLVIYQCFVVVIIVAHTMAWTNVRCHCNPMRVLRPRGLEEPTD